MSDVSAAKSETAANPLKSRGRLWWLFPTLRVAFLISAGARRRQRRAAAQPALRRAPAGRSAAQTRQAGAGRKEETGCGRSAARTASPDPSGRDTSEQQPLSDVEPRLPLAAGAAIGRVRLLERGNLACDAGHRAWSGPAGRPPLVGNSDAIGQGGGRRSGQSIH
jgi:hypothetical protein